MRHISITTDERYVTTTAIERCVQIDGNISVFLLGNLPPPLPSPPPPLRMYLTVN